MNLAAQPNSITSPQRLLIIQHASVFEHIGGIEYYLDDFACLAATTYGRENVHAIVPVRDSNPVDRSYAATSVPRATRRWIRKLQNRFFLSLAQKASETITKEGSSLIINSHVSLGPLAYWLSKRHHIPYVTLVYGAEAWGNLWPQDEWCLRRSSSIISISEWTKKILVDRGIDKRKIQIVHPRLTKELENAEGPTKTKREHFRFLTISRLAAHEQYKGQDHVLQALSILKKTQPQLKIKYAIQGEGTDLLRLRNLVTSLDLTDRVGFLPQVKTREELRASYSDADVFIMPSRFGRWNGVWRGEGFGIVYVEAAAFGVPSIAYDCGGARDIIRNGETGLLIEPDNILELANAMAKLATDQRLARQYGAQAKAHVQKTFTELPIRAEMISALKAIQG